jgi:hypothetical protein
VSEIEGKKGTDTGSDLLGYGIDLELGRIGAPQPFSFFDSLLFFSLFCFLNPFITFSFELQIDSNQFLKFSKI